MSSGVMTWIVSDYVDKRKMNGLEVSIVTVCGSGVLHVHSRLSPGFRIIAVLNDGRSGGQESPQEAHRRISQ